MTSSLSRDDVSAERYVKKSIYSLPVEIITWTGDRHVFLAKASIFIMAVYRGITSGPGVLLLYGGGHAAYASIIHYHHI